MDFDLTPTSSADAHFDELDIGSHEFTEDDVLPFLLQAQDIIAKLESRVIELETDLSTIHCKYEHDRQDWLVGLSQKDHFIHYLSNKLQKLEFNSKEAIVLLSDMDTNHPSVNLCLDYLRHAQQTTLPIMSIAPEESKQAIEDLEEGELERRQAEWNRQRKTDMTDAGLPMSIYKSPVNAMVGVVGSPETSDTSSSFSQPLDDPSESEGVTQDDGMLSAEKRDSVPAKHVSSSTASPYRVGRLSAESGHQTFCANCRQLLAQLDQQIEQKAYLKRDLGALAAALTEEERRREHIGRVKEELEEDVEEVASSLFTSLNEILMDEVTNRDGLVRLNREVEAKLTPVLAAWDVREQRLKQVKEFLVELDKVVHQSSCQTATHPRGDETADDDAWMAGTTSAAAMAARQSQMSLGALHRTSSSGRSSFSLHTLGPLDETGAMSSRAIRVDGLVFDEFREHLKALAKLPQVAVPSTPFMKRVLSEDIDPCLFQNTGSSWWKSPWFKRKLMDAIAKNKCDIQPWHTENPSLSIFSSCSSNSDSPTASRISMASSITTQPTPPKTKCTCCGLLRVCEFRMRLHATQTPAQQHKQQQKQKLQAPQQPWLPIDRFCRDRLVAVCDFYSFITHVRQGLQQNVPVLNLFRQCLNWRRRMAFAKIGSKALFDDSGRYSYTNNRRRSHSSRGESTVYDHSGSGSDTGSVVSVSDIQGLDGANQIVIVH